MMKKTLLYFVLLIGHVTNVTAQYNDIAQANAHIADRVARNNVIEFFIQRFGYIHQTNAQCISIVDKIESLAKQLKTPELFSQKYTSSQQAYASLEVVADLMLRENNVSNEILKLQEELELQKKNLKSTELFLNYDRASVEARFPKPNNIDNSTVYYDALWDEYQTDVREHGQQMKYYTSKCIGMQFDVRNAVEKRKSGYETFYNKLTDYYGQAYQEEFARNILSKYTPTENTKLMLAIQSAFDELDRRYRDAIMLDSDYFKALSFIDSYENLATIILTRAVPRESNPSIRTEAEGEIKRRVLTAKNYKQIIKKQKPSYWLNQKYLKVQLGIKGGKISCNGLCVKNMDQVASLISAARIIEDISNEPIYSMLGYQALDFVK